MQENNPFDRLARRLRGFFIIAMFAAVPVVLISYFWMIAVAYHAAPGWIFAIIVIAHLLSWLGLSSLLDIRQEQKNPLQGDRF